MAYAIIRTAKLKGAGRISRSVGHAYREREVPNADPERTKDNEVLVPYDAEQTRNDIEHARTRSDNVEMVEVMMTTSPEWMKDATPEQKAEFARRSQEFLEEKFGKPNVRSLVWHRDETTDHLSGHVTPIDKDGHLNCKEYLGGRDKMRELQNEFAEKMHSLGLERGLEGSRAKHTEIQRYYAHVNEPQRDPEQSVTFTKTPLPEPVRGMGGLRPEPNEEYGERVRRAVLKGVVPMVKELRKQVEDLKRDNKRLAGYTRWSRDKAQHYREMKARSAALEAKMTTVDAKLQRTQERNKQLEQGLALVGKSKTIEPAIKATVQKIVGKDLGIGR